MSSPLTSGMFSCCLYSSMIQPLMLCSAMTFWLPEEAATCLKTTTTREPWPVCKTSCSWVKSELKQLTAAGKQDSFLLTLDYDDFTSTIFHRAKMFLKTSSYPGPKRNVSTLVVEQHSSILRPKYIIESLTEFSGEEFYIFT